MTVKEFESAAEFEAAKKADAPLVVDFFAEWCGPCKQISPKFKDWSMKPEYSKLVFGSVNVDELGEVADTEKIQGMPTFKFYHKGELVGTVVGASEREILEKIESLAKRVSQ